MSKQSAIVTGGGRGIGRAIVDRLLADGFDVLACGRSAQPEDFPSTAHWVQADVSSTTDCDKVVSAAVEKFGSLTTLVNNAGVQVEKTLAQSTDQDWDLVVGVNCKGVFNMSRACLEHLQHTGGSILNIGSISGNLADPGMALYNASKAFVHGLTRSIAVDQGPAVRCNAVQPGWIMTGMADDAFAQAKNVDAAKADALARHPVGRMGTPEDIANMISYLASDKAAFISGQCFTVDGGMTSASPLRPGLM